MHLFIIYFIFLLFTCQLLRKPIKSYLAVLVVIPRSRSLVITFCSSLGSTLLLIEKATIDPLHLWVINEREENLLALRMAKRINDGGRKTKRCERLTTMRTIIGERNPNDSYDVRSRDCHAM